MAFTSFPIPTATFASTEFYRFYDSRAEFEAANVSADTTTWFLIHQGVLLAYVRNPSGTAITSANGVKGSPAGEAGRPEHWGGGLDDGTTDETAIIQAGWDAMSQGDEFVFTGGKTYCATNLKLPKFTSGQTTTRFRSSGGKFTIKRIAGGDTSYTIANAKYLENLEFADTPMLWQDAIIDGNNICDVPYIHRAYGSTFERCLFKNGNVHCFEFSASSANGLVDSTSGMSNCKWINCNFEAGATTSGALFKTTPTSAGFFPTDGFLIACEMQGGGVAPYCMDMATMGGWVMDGNHLYNATIRDMRVRKMGKSGPITSNIFEDGAVIDTAGEKACSIGPGNVWWEDLEINFDTGSALVESITVQGDVFAKARSGGVFAQLVLDTANSNKTLYSVGNAFGRTDGHVDNSGANRIQIINAMQDSVLTGHQGGTGYVIDALRVGSSAGSLGSGSINTAAGYYAGGVHLFNSTGQMMTARLLPLGATISSGSVTYTAPYMEIDTEAAAATDDLDTITIGVKGSFLVVVAANTARTVVLKDGTGNLRLAGDCTLDSNQDTIMLVSNGTAWLEVSRSDNGT